jgi:hypothetical protein
MTALSVKFSIVDLFVNFFEVTEEAGEQPLTTERMQKTGSFFAFFLSPMPIRPEIVLTGVFGLDE